MNRLVVTVLRGGAKSAGKCLSLIHIYLSALIMRIASTVQNNIWWNYVDQEEYFEMAEGDGRRYLPDEMCIRDRDWPD